MADEELRSTAPHQPAYWPIILKTQPIMPGYIKFHILILIAITLVGCNSTQQAIDTTPSASSLTTHQSSIIDTIPTPVSTDTSTVTGFLLQNKENPRATQNAILYLGVVMMVDGTPVAGRLNRSEAIGTKTDANGLFIFTDVPEGTYILILDRISDSFMLQHPDTGEEMLIEVDGGQVIDLGNLVYTQLPIP